MVKVLSDSESLEHNTLAAYKLMTSSAAFARHGTSFKEQDIQSLMQEALNTAAQACGKAPMDTANGSSLLMLSIVHAKLHNDASWIVTALAQSAQASESSVMHAARFLKFLDPSTVAKVDGVLEDKPGWEAGPVTDEPTASGQRWCRPSSPKAVVFVLDCSGSMGGTRLNNCKQALLDIYSDNINDTDKVALVTFASDVRVDLDWTLKADDWRGRVPVLFNQLTTRGLTAMYDGVARAVQLTQKDGGMPGYDNWIVLLCDGDDGNSRVSCNAVAKQLKGLSDAGILKGLIAIAAGSGVRTAAMEQLANATSGGMLIQTSDSGIGEAFGRAAAQIESGGLSESL